jgi:hypothetical protein
MQHLVQRSLPFPPPPAGSRASTPASPHDQPLDTLASAALTHMSKLNAGCVGNSHKHVHQLLHLGLQPLPPSTPSLLQRRGGGGAAAASSNRGALATPGGAPPHAHDPPSLAASSLAAARQATAARCMLGMPQGEAAAGAQRQHGAGPALASTAAWPNTSAHGAGIPGRRSFEVGAPASTACSTSAGLGADWAV